MTIIIVSVRSRYDSVCMKITACPKSTVVWNKRGCIETVELIWQDPDGRPVFWPDILWENTSDEVPELFFGACCY